jgi:signal transduction histidine kinase
MSELRDRSRPVRDVETVHLAAREKLRPAARRSSHEPSVVLTDHRGRVTYASARARSLLGLRAGDLVGRHLADLVGQGHRPEVAAWVTDPDRPPELALELVRRPGLPGLVRGIARPSPGRRGEEVVLVLEGVIEPPELSDAVRLAQALADDLRELAARNEELEGLMVGVAHDLRAPLMAVASAAQGLVRSIGASAEEEDQALVAHLLYAVGRMRDTIDTFLRSARAGGGPCLTRVDVDDVVALTLVTLAALIDETGAVVEVDRLGVVTADADQLGSVFLNLVENALTYRRGGRPPQVRISVEQLAGERRFSVADDGPGVHPDDQERLLRLFERGVAAPAGTGVGLAVCRRVVEGHGGRIWLEGNERGGTTVHFALPSHPRTT